MPTTKPDPEGMNDSRARWAASAVYLFQRATGADRCDALADLLCDLMHYADRDGFVFEDELDRARMHYDAETSGTVTILVDALNIIAAGNTDPDRMVQIAADALESFCPERGRTKPDISPMPFGDDTQQPEQAAGENAKGGVS